MLRNAFSQEVKLCGRTLDQTNFKFQSPFDHNNGEVTTKVREL